MTHARDWPDTGNSCSICFLSYSERRLERCVHKQTTAMSHVVAEKKVSEPNGLLVQWHLLQSSRAAVSDFTVFMGFAEADYTFLLHSPAVSHAFAVHIMCQVIAVAYSVPCWTHCSTAGQMTILAARMHWNESAPTWSVFSVFKVCGGKQTSHI